MKYYFITGTSSGIGLAMAQMLLAQNNKVIGLSRTHKIQHENYSHVELDLANPEVVNEFNFEIFPDATEVVLVNNAGQIGDIKPVGRVNNQSLAHLFNVNVTSLAVLMNNFIAKYQEVNISKKILNVSSGAGKNAIEGWAAYCASKAAVDLFSQTAFEEQKRQKFPVMIYSIAPGVVDTQMQNEIRSSNEIDFPKHNHFVGLKANEELSAPSDVAEKYLYILNNTANFPNCVFSLRDLAN